MSGSMRCDPTTLIWLIGRLRRTGAGAAALRRSGSGRRGGAGGGRAVVCAEAGAAKPASIVPASKAENRPRTR